MKIIANIMVFDIRHRFQEFEIHWKGEEGHMSFIYQGITFTDHAKINVIKMLKALKLFPL